MFESIHFAHVHALSFDGCVKNYFHRSRAHQQFSVRQKYPIVRNGDGYDGYLFFDSQPEGPVFEPHHVRRLFAEDATLRVDHQAFALVEGEARFDKRIVLAFEFIAVYRDVKLAIHETEERNILHVVLSYEDGVDGSEAHGGNVEIRKMIGAEDILLTRIKWGLAFYLYGKKVEEEG